MRLLRICDSTKIFCAGPYPKFTVLDVVGCEETSDEVNPEKLVLVVVWGANFDTQLIPNITPLLLSGLILIWRKIAIKGNNSKYIEARIMVLVYCSPSPFSYVCFVWFVV